MAVRSRRMKKRLFFATYPDLPARRALHNIQSQTVCEARAVSAETLHLTLAFLGACEESLLASIHAAASSVRAAPFTCKVERYDVFAKQSLLALVPAQTAPGLLSLRQGLAQALRSCDIRLQKEFYPHVTLFRNLKSAFVEKKPEREVAWRVTAFALVESSLRPAKADYKTLYEYELGA